MNKTHDSIAAVRTFFDQKITTHGAVPAGLDCRDEAAVTIRYDQILKAIDRQSGFSLLDFGCGYGGLAPYMERAGYRDFDYIGRDLSPAMIDTACRTNAAPSRQFEVGATEALPQVDYAVASGVFNMKLDAPLGEWTEHVTDTLRALYACSSRAIAANFLTAYSDADRMRPDLFYAQPEQMFAFGKSLSKEVALLHDYGLYDFTLIIRRPMAVSGHRDAPR